MTDRKPLDGVAISAMLLITASWGFQQVTVKWIAGDVSFVMQAAIRSILATILLLSWARWRGLQLFHRDGTFWPGIIVGVLFAFEFVFIYGGLAHTNASRMSVFIYLSPPLTALGLHFFVQSERLSLMQWSGVLIAFGGIALAFADGFTSKAGSWVGDLYGVIAAVFWAATTVLIRATSLSRASAAQTLFYQLAVSAAVLPLASFVMGEPGVVNITGLVAAALLYQGAIVAFASYLAWFWLLTRYLAAPLSVLSFLTPMFGVLSGVVFLKESISVTFVLAALLVGAGIVLVNLRR